jgi:hypothetical protein
MQNADVGQEAAVKIPLCESTSTGLLQMPWLSVIAPPPVSSTRQNVVEAQEMATGAEAESVATVCQLPVSVEDMMVPALSTA